MILIRALTLFLSDPIQSANLFQGENPEEISVRIPREGTPFLDVFQGEFARGTSGMRLSEMVPAEGMFQNNQ